MTEQKSNIVTYDIKPENVRDIDKYLGSNSTEYGFVGKKGEEGVIYFVDNSERIFAILDTKKNNLQLADYANLKIKQGVEKILEN